MGKDAADVKGDEAAAPTALVYILTHKNAEAMKKSFGDFINDDAWKTAFANSEKKLAVL